MSPRVAVAALCLATGCERELPVLLYHAVGCGTSDVRDVPLAEFTAQLDAATAAGYHFLPLARLFDSEENLPPKPVFLTFDDGAVCQYTQAFPAVLMRGIPFTLFVPAEWLQSGHAQDLGAAGAHRTLTVSEVRAMLASNLATLGAHGLTHLELRKLDEAQAKAEIGEPRKLLQQLFGAAPATFAYPYGSFSARDAQLARAAGYTAAFAVSVGGGGRYAYHRRSIHAGMTPDAFLRELDTRQVFRPLANE